MLLSISVIVVLLILSAFFSGSETALTAASRPLMHQMERKGSRGAGIVKRLRKRKDRLIGTILLGNNLANIMASAIATNILITLYGDAGVAYATIGMTLLVLIFAEILPKTYAFHNADRAAVTVAPVINSLVFILAPVTMAVNFIVRGIFLPFRVNLRANEALASSTDELRGAIDLHDGGKSAVKHERAMLRSVLDLAEVQVGEIMIHRKDVAMINADLPPEKVVDEVLASSFTRFPLWRNKVENIVGVLHSKALLRKVKAIGDDDGGGGLRGLDVVSLAAKAWFIPESTSLLDQLYAFRERREHFALIVDEYGSFLGVVTLEDILEEIVGDISDEHDIVASGVTQNQDGSYNVKGSITIRDLNRQFGWRLPDEEAATVAGLILHESRRIPEAGQVFMFYGFRFEILRRKRHQIVSIRVTPRKDTK